MTAFFIFSVKGRCPVHLAFPGGTTIVSALGELGTPFFSEKDIGDRRCPFSILSPVQVILP